MSKRPESGRKRARRRTPAALRPNVPARDLFQALATPLPLHVLPRVRLNKPCETARERRQAGRVGLLPRGKHVYGNRNISDLSSLLDAVEDRQREAWRSEHLTVGNILDRMGQRAHGPLLLAMGLLSVSPATLVPGATWLLAAMTFVVAVQLFVHRPRTWMPRKALRVKVSHARLASFVRAARPAAMAVDRVVRPRWRFFLEPPFVSLVALMCAVAALITFPLGLVPLAPLVPGLAIVFFGLGLTARDGLLLALGLVVVSAGVVLILVA